MGKIGQFEESIGKSNADFSKLVGNVKAIEGEVVGLNRVVGTQEQKLNSLHGSIGEARG